MKKAYQFRIYPKRKEETRMLRTLSTCRHLYNSSLSERKRRATSNTVLRMLQVFPWGKPEWISYEEQANDLSAHKDVYQKEVYSQVLQNTLKRLDRSFSNFFNGFGYPRFKGRNRYDSFTYPQKGFELKAGHLVLSKIGTVRIFQHREIEGKIKTCTIKKDVDQWYAIFTVEINKAVEPVPIKSKVGIEVGLATLLTLSNGEEIEPPEFLRASEKKLVRAQKHLSRKTKGSHNRKKHIPIVARIHGKIRNQRKEFAHKTNRMLVDTYDHIVFEDLQVKNMMGNHHLAKSISDAGWSQLISMTQSKAEYAGKLVEQVNANGTSQTCVCGYHVPKDLSVRWHSCPACGLELGRDRVSAMVIGNRGMNSVPTDCGELTPVESIA